MRPYSRTATRKATDMGKLDAKAGGIKAVSAAQNSSTQTSEERRWRAEDHLRTAIQYHKGQRDTSLVKDVQQLATQQMKDLAHVAGIAAGASTRTGSSPDRRTSTQPPRAAKAASKTSSQGAKGGGSKAQGPRSGKSVK